MTRSRTICTALLAALVLLLGASCSDDDSPVERGETSSDEVQESLAALESGVCFDGMSSGAVDPVDCSEPHDYEVVETHELDDGDYPGEEELFDRATTLCSGAAFEDYVGISAEQAESIGLVWDLITPDEQSWSSGDRRILCVATAATRLSQSVEDAGPQLANEGLPRPTLPEQDELDVGSPSDPPEILDTEIAGLADQCRDGDLVSCDDLWATTAIGTAEYRYGATCGGRVEEDLDGSCEDLLGG